MAKTKKILITIDVEDWFQVENLRQWFPPSTWDNTATRVEQNTQRILELLDSINLAQTDKYETDRHVGCSTCQITPKATFFVLGWVAKKFPDLIREICKRGHEVASHGYNHMMCNQLTLDELKEDLIRSKRLIEDITGIEVKGYRAPNFSISDVALKSIQEAGYSYDSSYNNFSQHGRYGKLSIKGYAQQGIATHYSKNFFELPISNLNLAGQILPWGGGGYFRFLPFPIFKAGIRHILKVNNAYMFYIHPWEIDPDQPKVNVSRGLSGWRHYLNLDKTYSRLKKLLSTFSCHEFITCNQYIERLQN